MNLARGAMGADEFVVLQDSSTRCSLINNIYLLVVAEPLGESHAVAEK
jgi:hypothetical protein